MVRVGDEFVVDLMRQACGINFAEASPHIVTLPVAGVPIPFASPKLLWRTKQTHRDKDAINRAFLAILLKQRGEGPEQSIVHKAWVIPHNSSRLWPPVGGNLHRPA